MKKHDTKVFIDNCNYLKLIKIPLEYQAMIDRATAQEMGYLEFISTLIQEEVGARRLRSINYRIRESRLPRPFKLLDDFNFSFQPNLKKKLIMDLSTMDWMRTRRSVLFEGRSGTGKSHLARSLALIACQSGYKVYYTTCANMLHDLNTGVYEKTLYKRMRKYINPDLLLIDEMGHDRLELEVTREAHLLFKVIDERYNKSKSLMMTTNVDRQGWAEYLGDPVSTQAILDRIYHHSVKVHIKGKSYREYEGELLQEQYNS